MRLDCRRHDESALLRRLDENIADFMAKRARALKPRRRAWRKASSSN
jgi:hypothetical protein